MPTQWTEFFKGVFVEYRRDIDGLRAVAVLLVLFFHVDIPFFSGGFVGVDVFFTLSGFLISSILLRQIATANFSFRRFYTRRAARLLPAYLFMLLGVTIAAYVILAPMAFSDFLQSAVWASVSLSNLHFMFAQGGYFATASHEIPLLHTWSLSVEEQFYILMPLLLVLWSKIANVKIRIVLFVIGLLLSFALSLALTQFNQKFAYFLVLSRAYEFLIGSAFALWLFHQGRAVTPSSRLANMLAVTGLLSLVLVSVFYSSATPFPSYYALVPCLATVALIYAGMNASSLVNKLLSVPIMVFIGVLSYSIYLWHWPLVALAKYAGIGINGGFAWQAQVTIILASIGLAFISYRVVENPLRHAQKLHTWQAALSLYCVPALLMLGFWGVSQTSGFVQQTPQEIVTLERTIKSLPEQGREECHAPRFNVAAECLLGEKHHSFSNGVLWGDSHANHFSPFVDVVGKHNGMAIRDITMGNCPPIFIVDGALEQSLAIPKRPSVIAKQCLQKNAEVSQFLVTQLAEYSRVQAALFNGSQNLDQNEAQNQVKNQEIAAVELTKATNTAMKKQSFTVFLAASWYGYIATPAADNPTATAQANWVIASLRDTIQQLQQHGASVIVFSTLARSSIDLSQCPLRKQLFAQLHPTLSCEFAMSQSQADFALTIQNVVLQSGAQWLDINELTCQSGRCSTVVDGIPVYRDNNHLNRLGAKYLGELYINNLVLE